MPSKLEAARERVRAAKSIAVLTGAGISAESGIPTFRSNGDSGGTIASKIWRPRRDSRAIPRSCGDIWTVRCTGCAFEEQNREELNNLPPRCRCGALLRPGVVWFGEMLPENALPCATAAAGDAEVFLVAGTSAQVFPAAGLIPLAMEHGAAVIEVNPEKTDFSADVTFALRGPAAAMIPQLI